MTRASSSSASLVVDWPPSRSADPSRSSWRVWLSAALCALGAVYGSALLAAETAWSEGRRTGSLSGVLLGAMRAEAIFPSSARLREALAFTSSQIATVEPIVALAFIKSAQRQAPHDPGLWYFRAVQHLRAGDRVEAEAAAARLRALVPDWPQTRQIDEFLKETAL